MSVKISELPLLDSLADNDIIAGVDTSADTTSKIEMSTLKDYLDLTNYVKNTDYATTSKGGVIKIGVNGASLDADNRLYANTVNYSSYLVRNDHYFISKGTLENVLNARIGDIQTLLDTLYVGSGV
jgi:hypothetical protein